MKWLVALRADLINWDVVVNKPGNAPRCSFSPRRRSDIYWRLCDTCNQAIIQCFGLLSTFYSRFGFRCGFWPWSYDFKKKLVLDLLFICACLEILDFTYWKKNFVYFQFYIQLCSTTITFALILYQCYEIPCRRLSAILVLDSSLWF